jgi:hypothetical protein
LQIRHAWVRLPLSPSKNAGFPETVTSVFLLVFSGCDLEK